MPGIGTHHQLSLAHSCFRSHIFSAASLDSFLPSSISAMCSGWKLSQAAALGGVVLLLLLSSFCLGTARTGDNMVGDTIVTGTVYCDQCRDGNKSSMDFPLLGAIVGVECAGDDGVMESYKEDTTNWLGVYTIWLHGRRNLSHCKAVVVVAPAWCWSENGMAGPLSFSHRSHTTERYTVEPLLSQPTQRMSFCDEPIPTVPVPSTSPPLAFPPTSFPPASEPPCPPAVPSLPPSVVPRPPACSHEKWTMRKYRCYWKVVSPNTSVAEAFGLMAAQRYGTNMTLWEGMRGKDQIWRTLLREGTTALLNSINSHRFFYPTLEVIDRMNRALVGPPRRALTIASNFRGANSGSSAYGGAICRFKSCS